MEISGGSDAEARLAVLEKKYQDMDALVKGLLDELLDLKSISSKMSRQVGEYRYQDAGREQRGTLSAAPVNPAPSSPFTSSSEGNTIIHPRGVRQPEVPAVPAEPEMVRIMQTDGTMKMEPRYGDQNHIDSAGYGRNRKGQLATAKQEPLIYAADEEKPGSAKK